MKSLWPLLVVISLAPLNAISAASAVTVAAAWSRPAFDNGVVYATLINGASQADALIGAKSPVARHVEIHEGTTSMSPMGGSMVSMQRVLRLTVPAHGTAVLSPGKYHIMLIGLTRSLTAGMTFPLSLDFRRAGWITVNVHVRPME